MKRRTALLSSVAAIATVAGIGAALWRTRQSAASTVGTDIWSMRFDAPQGGPLELAASRGNPMLLNFWATWCPPCVSELPLLDRFHREHQLDGWQVVGLAIDNREPVIEFLGRRPVGFPIGLAGTGGVELARALGNVGGGLPFTVVFDRSGKAVERKLGVLRPEDLQRWVALLK
jgi:thiol-disulfide isomerase/thioredoxin